MISQFRRLLLLGFGCALLASADEVTFNLSTSGSFSSGTPGDLTFTGIGTALLPGFTGTTTGGSLSLSNLGTFAVQKPSQGADNYTGDTFTLNLLFFDPAGISTPTGFSAALTGTVNTQQGSIFIDFGPAQTFHFSNSQGSGAFDLSIADLTLTIPHDGSARTSQALSGSITNAFDPPTTAPVPEPGSIILFGSVLLFVSAQLRKRLRKTGGTF